jgi:hypothetical protein
MVCAITVEHNASAQMLSEEALDDRIAAFESDPNSQPYFIAIQDLENGDFAYVFIEVNSDSTVEQARTYESDGDHSGHIYSQGQLLGDFINEHQLSIQLPPCLLGPNCPNSQFVGVY